jgi:hypothetical protein
MTKEIDVERTRLDKAKEKERRKPLCMFLGKCEHFSAIGSVCLKNGYCSYQSRTPEEHKKWAKQYLK